MNHFAQTPDLDTLKHTLKGDDPEAWSEAARELAAHRPHPLDDGWFTAHPHSCMDRFGGEPEIITILKKHLVGGR